MDGKEDAVSKERIVKLLENALIVRRAIDPEQVCDKQSCSLGQPSGRGANQANHRSGQTPWREGHAPTGVRTPVTVAALWLGGGGGGSFRFPIAFAEYAGESRLRIFLLH